MKQKISINILLICIGILTGCLTSKKVDRQVAKQYTDIPEPKKNKPEDIITISTTLPTVGKIPIKVYKSSFIL